MKNKKDKIRIEILFAIFAIALFIMVSISIVHMTNVNVKLCATLNTTQLELTTAKETLRIKEEQFDALTQDYMEAEDTIFNLQNEVYEFKYLGDFDVTYYCDERYSHICGGTGITASGVPTEVGVTIAVDDTVIPMGTLVYIEGIGYRIAQDRGGAIKGNKIDVLVDTHQEALDLGRTTNGVWVLIKIS